MSFLCEIHVEKGEDESKHGRAQAIAQAAHPGDHALNEALLVRVRMHGDEGRDGRIRYAGKVEI